MKYELFVGGYVLYQLLIYLFMRQWVNKQKFLLTKIVEDRRLHSTLQQNPVVLTHAQWRRKVVLALFLLMQGLMIAPVIGEGPSIQGFSWSFFMVGVIIFLGLGWGPWALVAEAYGIAMVFDGESITRLSPWSKVRTIKWREVESITYSWFWAWFTLRSAEGSIHVTTVIEGLDKFAQVVLSQVPHERIIALDWINAALRGPFRY